MVMLPMPWFPGAPIIPATAAGRNKHIHTDYIQNNSTSVRIPDITQAFDSIAGNTVVPYLSLKKFFNYHKLLFIAIYNYFNFMIKNYNYDVHLTINLSHALISPSYITETGYLSNTT